MHSGFQVTGSGLIIISIMILLRFRRAVNPTIQQGEEKPLKGELDCKIQSLEMEIFDRIEDSSEWIEAKNGLAGSLTIGKIYEVLDLERQFLEKQSINFKTH